MVSSVDNIQIKENRTVSSHFCHPRARSEAVRYCKFRNSGSLHLVCHGNQPAESLGKILDGQPWSEHTNGDK